MNDEGKKYYNKAIEDYDYVIRNLHDVNYTQDKTGIINSGITLGEQAFIEKIKENFLTRRWSWYKLYGSIYKFDIKFNIIIIIGLIIGPRGST